MKNTHDLKTDPKVFQDVINGNKTFEIRFNDRDFQVGDELILKETKYSGEQMKNGNSLEFTGRQLIKNVSYVLSGYGLQDGWVILGIIDKAGQQSQQAKIDELQAKYDELNNRATFVALDQMTTAKLNYELQARVDEIVNHVDINFDECRDDDQHSYWSGYNQAMRELNYILKGNKDEI